MTRKTKNTQGRAADEDKETSAAAEKPREEPATSSQPAHAEAAETDQGAKAPSRAAASAPDPEGQAADQGAQTSAAAEGPAQGPEATTAPAKTGEADAGSPAPGSEEAKEAAIEARLAPVRMVAERMTEMAAAAMVGPEPSGREVVVVGPKRGRWRAGRHFGAEPVRIPVEELTEDEKAALVADPVLIVSVAEVSRRP